MVEYHRRKQEYHRLKQEYHRQLSPPTGAERDETDTIRSPDEADAEECRKVINRYNDIIIGELNDSMLARSIGKMLGDNVDTHVLPFCTGSYALRCTDGPYNGKVFTIDIYDIHSHGAWNDRILYAHFNFKVIEGTMLIGLSDESIGAHINCLNGNLVHNPCGGTTQKDALKAGSDSRFYFRLVCRETAAKSTSPRIFHIPHKGTLELADDDHGFTKLKGHIHGDLPYLGD